MDRDFIDIKFGDKWASEFNLVVVSKGDRYTPPMYGNINSNTSTVAGKRGVYKWKTQYNEKIFTVNIAFDSVPAQSLNDIKRWLNPNKVQKLIFSDEPYKFYYACLNTDPGLEYLAFIGGEEKVVGGRKVISGVYKGELTLEFNVIDGVAYSDTPNFESVEIGPNLTYENSEYNTSIVPWIAGSNLLNNDNYATAARIYASSFYNQDTGRVEDCGLGPDFSHRFYLLNSGNTDAKLNLSFDFVLPGEQPLVIYTQRVKKLNGDGWQSLGIVSAIVIENFSDYIPFQEYLGEEDYGKITGTNINAKKEVMAKYLIEIDSELREIYIKEKANPDNVLSLNKFNGNRNFLTLCESNFIDYSKPFPTIYSDNGAIEPTKIVYEGTAIENTYFNEVFLGMTDTPYRLVNVRFDWKSTYN